MWTVLQQLSTHHHNNLRYLIKFLRELWSRSHTNKMTLTNIALVVTPKPHMGPGPNGGQRGPRYQHPRQE
ncbi:hypothetical protein Pmani_039384 [Petrolisthes manimaculis]|uniref:Rho-GAP domain-containing protein n=1 Tax=Petrolisthes manimaculis TaxID=1843537 RepID=A0AAE1NE94_9EUCA|nr:hypothetical protein Pmani_039384 [Petrolisthes manimaculis]